MRRYDISIDGKPFIKSTDLRQFRVTFLSRMRYTDKLSFLDLGIYNLSRETNIEQGKEIVLNAGYDEEFDQIFRGRIITVLKEREGANIITRLLCRSGASDVRPSISLSFGQNSEIVDVLQSIAKQLGVSLNIDREQFKNANKLIRGFNAQGDMLKILDSLAYQFCFNWIHSADALIIDRKDKPSKGNLREVSLFTGMIGVPEAEGDIGGYFVRVNMKLSPRIHIRSTIDLKSEYASYSTGNFYITPPENGGKVSGKYKVIELVHRGDSWGERWQTEIRGQKI